LIPTDNPGAIKTVESPVACRIIQGSMDDFGRNRRLQYEERLRAEGFQLATQTVVKNLDNALEQLIAARGELEASAVTLATNIAQELIHTELSHGNYNITEIVRAVLADYSGCSGSTILRVHPEDADALKDVRFRTGTEVQADPGVRRADVHLQTDQGVLVRDIDECMGVIRAKLTEAMG
jgi:flagellar biosynthesis/type III secretory pathway protein FliH